MLHDTHFHLDLFENPANLADLIESRRIYTIAVTNLPGLFPNTEKLCEGRKYIKPALGYHPELVSKYNNQFELFLKLLNRTRYVGEIGLDNQQKTREDFALQIQIFEQIIHACAQAKNKILTVHSRKAEKEVIDAIGNGFPGKIILHWYSGTLEYLDKALSNGFYFSINSAMVKSKNGSNIIKNIPLSRLLLETDGPFIEYMGQKTIPTYTPYIIEEIAKLRNIQLSQLKETFRTNFRTLLS